MKSHVGELAIFGGAPAFSAPLHVNRPYAQARDNFQELIRQSFDASWFTNDGPLVKRFEDQLMAELNVPNVVLVANGTLGLELVMLALGLEGEVILPSFSFVSGAHVTMKMGLTPRFCDISAIDMNADAELIERMITPRTAAVVPTHIWGQPCAPLRLEAICRDAGVALIFDAAHGFGCSHQGLPVGSFGDAEVFSLHATKTLHSFEGGFITTRDDVLASKLRKMRNFGFTGVDSVSGVGTNAKMSEAHAAMGLANLARFDDIRARSAASHHAYRVGLDTINGVTFHKPVNDVENNLHYAVALVDEGKFGLSRDQLVHILAAENVLARRYYYPGVHRLSPYRDLDCGLNAHLPVTDEISKRVLVLPSGATVGPQDVNHVVDLIRLVGEMADEIRRHVDAG